MRIRSSFLAAMAAAMVLAMVLTAVPATATGGWEELGDMPFQTTMFSYAHLPDGKILFNGGMKESGSPSDETWLYDPEDDSWAQGAPSPVATYHSDAVAMPDGKVYLFCGQDANSQYDHDIMVYDVANDTWDQLPWFHDLGFGREAAALDDERIILAGGHIDDSIVKTAECHIYNIRTNTVSEGPSLPDARISGALVMADGSLYYIGGRGQEYSDDIYRLDMRLGLWAFYGSMPETRYSDEAAVGMDGMVYLSGGYADSLHYGTFRILNLKDNMT